MEELRESKNIGFFEIEIGVKGYLEGVPVSALWDCVSAKKSFIELEVSRKGKAKGSKEKGRRTLVLDLATIGRLVQIFDELGIDRCDNYTLQRPLWSLVSFGAAV